MRIGISSWTYPWALGVAGFEPPPQPFTLPNLLERASELKVSVVQLADNLPLHKLGSAEVREVRAQANSLCLTIELGTRGVEPAHLLRYLDLALELRAGLVRTLTHTAESKPSLGQAEKWIREVLPSFEAARVVLGLENYELHSSSELAALVRRLDSPQVGVCLDTVNSLGRLETPECVVETLAPFTVNLHVKDFVIERVPQMMGYVVRGAPAGSGMLEIPWLLGKMPPNRNMTAVLEQWPPLNESVEATVAIEREWAEQGVRYLRSCGCT